MVKRQDFVFSKNRMINKHGSQGNKQLSFLDTSLSQVFFINFSTYIAEFVKLPFTDTTLFSMAW